MLVALGSGAGAVLCFDTDDVQVTSPGGQFQSRCPKVKCLILVFIYYTP